jgi:hypothetical protein
MISPDFAGGPINPGIPLFFFPDKRYAPLSLFHQGSNKQPYWRLYGSPQPFYISRTPIHYKISTIELIHLSKIFRF